MLPPLFSSVCVCVWPGHFGTYKKKHYAREHNPDEATLKDLLATAAPVEGAAIVYSEVDDGVPPVLLHYMANIPAIQKVPAPASTTLTLARLPGQGSCYPSSGPLHRELLPFLCPISIFPLPVLPLPCVWACRGGCRWWCASP